MMNERPVRSHWCDRCKLAHSACSACGGLTDGGYDAHRASHHFCDSSGSTAPDEDRIYVEPRPVELVLQDVPEVWDSCNSCQGLWVRFGKGPRLDMRTHELHRCPTVEPAPTPIRPTLQEGNGTVPASISSEPVKPWRVIP